MKLDSLDQVKGPLHESPSRELFSFLVNVLCSTYASQLWHVNRESRWIRQLPRHAGLQQSQDESLGSIAVLHVRVEYRSLLLSSVAALLCIELLAEPVIAPFDTNLSSSVRVRDGHAVVWHHLSAALEELAHSGLDILRRFRSSCKSRRRWLEPPFPPASCVF